MVDARIVKASAAPLKFIGVQNMLKSEELSNPQSCLNKAKDDEIIFVLLSRDLAAPGTIIDWCHRRIELGLNTAKDKQIVEAMDCSVKMKSHRLELEKKITHKPSPRYRIITTNGMIAIFSIVDSSRSPNNNLIAQVFDEKLAVSICHQLNTGMSGGCSLIV